MPKFSIGLPCYNVAPYLQACLNSIYAQTEENWELIAIDDGSTDGTLALLKSQNDPRLRIISDGENCGLAARLNQVIDEAQTDIIVRQDADDLMFPQRLEKQWAYLQENSTCELVGTAMLSTDNDLEPKAERLAPILKGGVEEAFGGNYINHATIMARKSFFLRYRYDESLRVSEDFDLWLKSAGDLKAQNLQEVLYVYREFGCLTYDKYCQQSGLSKQLIAKYGPTKQINWQPFLKQRRRKDKVYALFNFFSAFDSAVQGRNKSLTSSQKVEYQKAIAQMIQSKS